MNVSFFEQQKQRKDKQFISVFDSVYFVSEHGKGTLQEAFELVTSSFLRKQTYLLLITPHSVKAVYVCSSYEQSTCEPYITFESIIHELKECIDHKSIGTGNPIYKLGFGKKRFVEQLINLGMQLPEQVIFNTESPDITDADYTSEGDELAFFQGLPKEYDILRADNEKLKAQYQELFNKKGSPEALYEIREKLYKSSREQLDKCKNELDKLSVDYKNLESDYDYCKRNFESIKKKTALTQQVAEKRISDLENQLAQANAALADKPAYDYQQLSERNEKSYQTTIGLLLELMVTPKGIDHKQPFSSQAVIISEITDKGIYGQGKSTLETRFSDANSILSDAKKK